MQVASAPLELFLLLAYAGRARGELDLIALRGGGGRCHGLVLFRLSNFAIASYLAFGHLILLDFRLIVGCSISMLRHDRAFVHSARTERSATKAGKPGASCCRTEPLDTECGRSFTFTNLLKPTAFAVSKPADVDEITRGTVKVKLGRHAVLLSLGPGH